MTTEHESCLPDNGIESKSDFYKRLLDNELSYRKKVSDSMSWLRPVKRLFAARELNRTDERLAVFGSIITDSLLEEGSLEAGFAQITVSGRERIDSGEANKNTETPLSQNPTAENNIAII